MGTDRDRELATVLRQYQPVSLRAYDAHDDTRDIAVPPGARTKWTRAAATVNARPWVRLDLLDKAGKVLYHVEHDGPAADVEDLSAPMGVADRRDERMLALMLRAQREGRDADRREMVDTLGACREMMRVCVDAVRALSEVQRAQMQAMSDAFNARMAAAAHSRGDDGGDATEDLLKTLLPTMLPAMLARSAAPAAAPAAAPNGVKPKV